MAERNRSNEQNSPEQNRGYDEAVRNGPPGPVQVDSTSPYEKRQANEGAADDADEGRGRPAPDKAEG